jgi:predicted metal-dependent phosphoesterase TrpH
MLNSLFRTQGCWLKGNLHMHTTRSDGHLAPDDALELYRKAGYNFAALTDHWVQSKACVSHGMTVLGGCEWDTGDMVHAPVYHIVGVGMDREVSLEGPAPFSPQQIIDAIGKAGGLAVLAHPAWSLTDPEAAARLTGLCGAEVYNTMSGLPWNGRRADSSLYFDLWGAKGKLFRCMAADDSHSYSGEQTTSFLMVCADGNNADAVKRAIRAGDFYASQGPRFRSVRFGDGKVEVECLGAETVVFYSNTVWCGDRVASGRTGFASYRIKSTDRYVRVELIDAEGRKAWCSPFWANDPPESR